MTFQNTPYQFQPTYHHQTHDIQATNSPINTFYLQRFPQTHGIRSVLSGSCRGKNINNKPGNLGFFREIDLHVKSLTPHSQLHDTAAVVERVKKHAKYFVVQQTTNRVQREFLMLKSNRTVFLIDFDRKNRSYQRPGRYPQLIVINDSPELSDRFFYADGSAYPD